MIIRQATLEQIETAAAQADVKLSRVRKEGRGYRLTIRPTENRTWQKVNRYTGRRIHAICWHGHREFMRELFKLAPDAIIRSAVAVYRGALDFELTHQATGY